MHTWRWVLGGWATASLVSVFVACGSGNGGNGVGATFPDASDTKDGTVRSDSGVLHQSDASGRGTDAVSADVGADSACAVTKTPATLVPAYLVFVMDRSDSMKQFGKFPACSAALDQFFADPSTTGISASLTFMPYVKPDADTQVVNSAVQCNSANYVTPEVPMTALPSTAFKPVIAAETLALGTPTTPALEGALEYAKGIKSMHPGSKVLLVLATDGYPAGCTNNTVLDVADAASIADTIDGIPVYVLGVGPKSQDDAGIEKLNTVAAAGGTDAAFFIPTETDGGDASVTENAFLAAVHQIQGQLGCDYAIPAPPSGQTLNYMEVNVVYTSGGTDMMIPYSKDCSNTAGWSYAYGDGGTPSQIVLCSGVCQDLKGTTSSGSVSVLFGCATSTGPSK
jgi:hypothetical protein